MSDSDTQHSEGFANTADHNNFLVNVVWLTKEELRSYMEGASLEHIFEQRGNNLKKLQEDLA